MERAQVEAIEQEEKNQARINILVLPDRVIKKVCRAQIQGKILKPLTGIARINQWTSVSTLDRHG